MLIKCLNCKSAYAVTAVKGDASAVPMGKKVTTRCALCTDVIAYTAHDVPKDEKEKDNLRVIVLHDHLWPRAEALCSLGRKDKTKRLICPGCPHAGVIDAKFCERAKVYNELLIKTYPDDEKPGTNDVIGIDETEAQRELGELTRPIDDYYMGEDDA